MQIDSLWGILINNYVWCRKVQRYCYIFLQCPWRGGHSMNYCIDTISSIFSLSDLQLFLLSLLFPVVFAVPPLCVCLPHAAWPSKPIECSVPSSFSFCSVTSFSPYNLKFSVVDLKWQQTEDIVEGEWSLWFNVLLQIQRGWFSSFMVRRKWEMIARFASEHTNNY